MRYERVKSKEAGGGLENGKVFRDEVAYADGRDEESGMQGRRNDRLQYMTSQTFLKRIMDCLSCGCGDLVCLLVIAIIILSIMVGVVCSVLFQAEEGIANRNNLLMHRAGHAGAVLFKRGTETEIGVARIFSEGDHGFRVVIEAQKLKPGSEHAVHIFEYSDPLNSNDGKIFDPVDERPHGCPGISAHYRAGDLGNIAADALGNAMADVKTQARHS